MFRKDPRSSFLCRANRLLDLIRRHSRRTREAVANQIGTKKWQRNGKGYGEIDVRFWKDALFKPKYNEAGRRIESENWSVRIQHQANARGFSGLASRNSENEVV